MTNASPLQAFHRRNALTFVSLAAGVGAIASAPVAGMHVAGALLAFAALADTFDGRFARSFAASHTDRALGAQLDSLVDAITFGIAPVVCVAVAAPPSAGWLMLVWWMAAAGYVAAAVSRLAFFNVSHELTPGFVGLPVPVSALIWSSALLAAPAPALTVVLFAALAIAMVLPFSVPRPRRVALVAFACWPLTLIASHIAAL